jgi:hypothetical protein
MEQRGVCRFQVLLLSCHLRPFVAVDAEFMRQTDACIRQLGNVSTTASTTTDSLGRCRAMTTKVSRRELCRLAYG